MNSNAGKALLEANLGGDILRILPSNIMLAEPDSLDYGERVAIYSYTCEGFRELNRQLRTNKLTLAHALFRDALSSALDKLPSYNGVCVRGLDENVFMGYGLGDELVLPAFTSATKGEILSKDYQECRVHLKIRSLRGKNVANFSMYKVEEDEILFNFGTRFAITSFDTSIIPYRYELLEVPQN